MKRMLICSLFILALFSIISVSHLQSVEAQILVHTNDTIDISPGEYVYYPFERNRGDELLYNFTVVNGPKVDVLIIWESELSQFQNNGTYGNYAPHVNATDGKHTFWIPDDEGYYLIFDNSNRSEASPMIMPLRMLQSHIQLNFL